MQRSEAISQAAVRKGAHAREDTLRSARTPPVASGPRDATPGPEPRREAEEHGAVMERIGEYLVRRMVGEGGMGKVYEAEERLSRRRVALKVLRGELSRSEDGRRLFVNEMAILSHLDHPNVVRCLACVETDNQLVMVLEFLEGRTLRSALTERGALPWVEAVSIAVQIAAALEAAHDREPGVVHRDLKPENVMILADGAIKVMDFGIAKVLEAVGGATTHSAGTLGYMSPEQIDASSVDARADLYALGLVLYEMLCGHPPFESPSPRELLNLQCTAAPPPLPDGVRAELPRGVERLIRRLLEKAPDDRPQSAAEVREELERFAPSERAPGAAGKAASRPIPARPARSLDAADTAQDSEGASSAVHDTIQTGPASIPAASTPESGRSSRRAAPAHDTAALVERVAAPREISSRMAVAVVVGLSLLAGLVTYWVRGVTSAPVPPRDNAAEPVR